MRPDESSSSEDEVENPGVTDQIGSLVKEVCNTKESGNPWVNDVQEFLQGFNKFTNHKNDSKLSESAELPSKETKQSDNQSVCVISMDTNQSSLTPSDVGVIEQSNLEVDPPNKIDEQSLIEATIVPSQSSTLGVQESNLASNSIEKNNIIGTSFAGSTGEEILSPKENSPERNARVSRSFHSSPEPVRRKRSTYIQAQGLFTQLIADKEDEVVNISESDTTEMEKDVIPGQRSENFSEVETHDAEILATNSGSWSVVIENHDKPQKGETPQKSSKTSRKNSLNDIFDNAEEAIKRHALNVGELLKSDFEKNEQGKSRKRKQKLDKSNNKSQKQHVRLQDIDEALIEINEDGISSGANDLKYLKDKIDNADNSKDKEPQIDPNKHINVKSQKLFSEIDEEENSDEEDEKQRMHLMEAFADDDIAEEFR